VVIAYFKLLPWGCEEIQKPEKSWSSSWDSNWEPSISAIG